MLTTRNVPGVPRWIELEAPNGGEAERFYGALFGWEPVRTGPGHGLFRLAGRTVAPSLARRAPRSR